MSWDLVEKKDAARRARIKARELPKSEQGVPFWDRPSIQAVVASLPEEQRAPFRQLVDDYKACAKFAHGSAFVDVKTLVGLGWRKP